MIVSIALVALLAVFNQATSQSVNPIVQARALECAQSKLDQILARKFDQNSPSGGVPACGSAEENAVACAGIIVNTAYNDVGDFAGQIDTSNADCEVRVSVTNAGADLGLPAAQARLIRVDVTSPGGGNATLSVYKANF